MNLCNATLIRQHVRLTGPDGSETFAAGSAIMARCTQVAPDRKAQAELGALLTSRSALLYVLVAKLPMTSFVESDRVEVALDNVSGSVTYTIKRAARHVKAGGLSHWELVLEEAGA